MIEVSQVILPLDVGLPNAAAEDVLGQHVAQTLGIPQEELAAVSFLKRSVDARKKTEVHFVATLAVTFKDDACEERFFRRQEMKCFAVKPKDKNVSCEEVLAEKTLESPDSLSDTIVYLSSGVQVKKYTPPAACSVLSVSAAWRMGGAPRPVVVGAGPAGLFAALYLAKAGARPLIVERGANVDERCRVVDAFDKGASLDVSTNIQFGEGGAGTFSDGKLTTGTKSAFIRSVLQTFVDAGAPEEILWRAMPHIGTDKLKGVIRALRQRIEELGGEIRFHTQLDRIVFEKGRVVGVGMRDTRTQATTSFEAQQVILACGHSARDTFELVRDAGIFMEQKPFSLGVRIEHPQHMIDRAQYGQAAGHAALGAASYKLALHLPNGRGVYTFCMCPGGTVVAAASEPQGIVVNGMSRFARDSKNANSALLVGVNPDDFGSKDVLAGIALQRQIEQAAYREGYRLSGVPYTAPAQTVGDFLAARAGHASTLLEPSYPRGVAWCDLRICLPTFVTDALVRALPLLDRKLHGFAHAEAVMTGVETRSSSPVRIVRDKAFQARLRNNGALTSEKTSETAPQTKNSDTTSVDRDSSCGSGLYPCGEGAGYAGGIMSAAVDGLRVAEALVRTLQ